MLIQDKTTGPMACGQLWVRNRRSSIPSLLASTSDEIPDCAKIENAVCQDDPKKAESDVFHHLAIDDPPRGQDSEEAEDTSFPVQPPRSTILRFLEEAGAQPLAILLAFLLALVVALFFIIRCAVSKKNPKQVTPTTM